MVTDLICRSKLTDGENARPRFLTTAAGLKITSSVLTEMLDDLYSKDKTSV